MGSETADHALGSGRDHRFMPAFFARVNIGDVNLHYRNGNGSDGVMKRDRRMAISAGVDGDAGGDVSGFVQPVDQHAFMIALAKVNNEAEAFAHGFAIGFDILECLAAIDAWLALAKGIQIGSVQDENGLRH